jgi:myb proto-oncogene protein
MSFSSTNPKSERNKFSKEEDESILNFVLKNGYQKIKDLASQLPNRTAKQIREKYRLYLDPLVSQSSFSKEEDINLVNYVQNFGKKWSIISNLMKGRQDVQLKF